MNRDRSPTLNLESERFRYRRVAASSLMITDVREEDHGSYQCRAENDIETQDAVAQVIVQGKRSNVALLMTYSRRLDRSDHKEKSEWVAVPPRFIKQPQDREASESQDLELECEIYGKPEPRITWLKNGERITLSTYWQLVNGYVRISRLRRAGNRRGAPRHCLGLLNDPFFFLRSVDTISG